jgi:hypothetical protein
MLDILKIVVIVLDIVLLTIKIIHNVKNNRRK